MPLVPSKLSDLADAYDRVRDTAQDLTDLALDVAPAAVRRVICTAGGVLGLGVTPLDRISPPGTGGRGAADIAGLLQRACEVPPPLPDESTPPPFPGGQCECVLYAVNVTFESPNGPPNTFTENRLGPIGAARRKPSPVPGQEDRTEIGYDFGSAGCGGRQFRLFASFNADSPGSDEWNLTVNSTTRLDGLADDCGDLPPPPPPPRPPIPQPPESDPIPRIDPDGNPLPPITIRPIVGPVYVDVDGSLNVPVTVNIDGGDTPITIPVNVNLGDFSPTINIGGSGGASGDDGPPKPVRPICCVPPPPRERPGEEEDPDEPPSEVPPASERIVGVTVFSSLDGSARASNSTIFTAAPPLLVPRIATVQFEIETEDGLFIGPDTQVKQRNQFVAAPEVGKVTRAFIRWEPGWSGEFKYLEETVPRESL